ALEVLERPPARLGVERIEREGVERERRQVAHRLLRRASFRAFSPNSASRYCTVRREIPRTRATSLWSSPPTWWRQPTARRFSGQRRMASAQRARWASVASRLAPALSGSSASQRGRRLRSRIAFRQ